MRKIIRSFIVLVTIVSFIIIVGSKFPFMRALASFTFANGMINIWEWYGRAK